ncbi:3'-5' exonuclease [Glaciihabitans sp. dw_435]|uniref:3'-5' exonuclease n=1 Tax=Glaciihabitans sp. dw_435 TaxID=2720081 RepID=UPI001BD6B869|nr:3'-5' exonuclease [Glaciihabitans sp. dw_435]
MGGYAVIDFETTGLFPGRHDRVVELAVVHVDETGMVEGAWDTLVNPQRDLGPQHIHGIRSSEILAAPTFPEIASRLVELLSGRTIVAHNASFDVRFLVAELARAGYERWEGIAALCTMQIASQLLPGSGRSLADCCAAFDIEIDGAHRAAADAMATARLLEAYLLNSPNWTGWLKYSEPPIWQSFVAPAVTWMPRQEGFHQAQSFLERITVKLPEFSGPTEQLDYLALLDRCLLDRQLSVHEATSLVSLAEDLGISRDTCETLHLRYFEEIAAVAWEDGILSPHEAADLQAVAALLSIPDAVAAVALEPRAATLVSAPPAHQFTFAPGDLIVLTGDMHRNRDEWHVHLIAGGYVPWGAVTKKVKVVAAADPDSLSGKAKKARDYGIPVVDEAWLTRLLDL